MGQFTVRFAGAGASVAVGDGDVHWSNPDKVTTSGQGDVTDGASTGQAHASLTPGQKTHALKFSAFNMGGLIGALHADAIIDGVDFEPHIFQAGNDAADNLLLKIIKVWPVIAGSLVGSGTAVDIPLYRATSTAIANHVRPLGSRDSLGRPNDLWDDGGGNDIDRADVVHSGFGFAIQVENQSGSLTSIAVCDSALCVSESHTAATDALITHDVSDPTGATESGNAPMGVVVDALGSKFGTDNPLLTYAKWTFNNPSGEALTIIDRRRGDVNGRSIDIRNRLRKLLAGWPILEAGLHTLELELGGMYYGEVLGTDSIDILAGEATRTNIRYVKTGGSNSADGTSLASAWQTLAHARATAPDDCIVNIEGGETHDGGSTGTGTWAQNTIWLRARPGSGVAILNNDGGSGVVFASFTGTDVVLDGRSMKVADEAPTEATIRRMFNFTSGAHRHLVMGFTGDTEIRGFCWNEDSGTITNRGLYFNNVFKTNGINAGYGIFAGSMSRTVIIDFAATGTTTGNGWFRFGGPGQSTTEKSMGLAVYYGENDCKTNDIGWGCRFNGALVFVQGLKVTGSGGNISTLSKNPGTPHIIGSYWHDIDGVDFEVDDDPPTGGGFGLADMTYTIYRNCVIDSFGRIGLWPYWTQQQGFFVNCHRKAQVGSFGSIITMGKAPWQIANQITEHANTDVYSSGSTTNGYSWTDETDENAGLDGPSILADVSDNCRDSASAGFLHQTSTLSLSGWNALSAVGTDRESAATEADYPEASNFAPDTDAAEARTGSDIYAGAQFDYRDEVRVLEPAWIGPTSADAETAPTIGLSVSTNATQAILSITPPAGNKLRMQVWRKQGAGSFVFLGAVAHDATSYTDELN